MKVFVMDRRRLRVFQMRHPGGACLRLVGDVWHGPRLAGGGDLQQQTTMCEATPPFETAQTLVVDDKASGRALYVVGAGGRQ